MMKKLLLAAALSTSLGTLSLPVMAADTIIVRHGPPPMRDEMTPPPRSGYVWVPGYWDWRHGRHQWTKGHWEKERRGYVYHQPQWRERDGRWEMNRGRWDRRDSDHDGVPNRRDDYPHDPRRD